MMRWLYDLGFLTFGLFSLPHFLQRIEQAEDRKRLIRERLGIFPEEVRTRFAKDHPVWIHCVSVGEVLAVEKFVELFRRARPDETLVLTTVTPTGQRMAKQWENDRVKVFYFPFDLGFVVRRFFDTIQPAALFLVETEIWPNVIEEARRRRIPVGIVNGRLSERSFRSFRRFGDFFRPVFSSIDFFLVQTEKDRERWVALGVNPAKVKVTGNMKLDGFTLNGQWEKDRRMFREKFGFAPSEKILIGGSTHPGEEEILLRVLRRLRDEGFHLKLVLAPRHIERFQKILKQTRKAGFRSMLASDGGPAHSDFEVLILDKLGELRRFYAVADAVFVGGSLVRHGGQNPVEPAACRRPMIHGPWVFNFEELYQRLDEEGGSLQVQGEEELVFVLKRLLTGDRESEYLGTRAFEILERLQGASERNFTWVGEKIGAKEKYEIR